MPTYAVHITITTCKYIVSEEANFEAKLFCFSRPTTEKIFIFPHSPTLFIANQYNLLLHLARVGQKALVRVLWTLETASCFLEGRCSFKSSKIDDQPVFRESPALAIKLVSGEGFDGTNL